MNIIQVIVGCLLALGFFGVAIYSILKKWKLRYSLFCLGASLLLFLGSLDWVQGFVQTQVITSLLSTSKEYGRQLQQFQTTTGEMKIQLSKQQGELDNQQKELTCQQERIRVAQLDIEKQQQTIQIQQIRVSEQQKNLNSQEQQLTNMQQTLAGTQERIQQQQKQVEDVEFLVRNLFTKMKTEQFACSDSNRVSYVSRGENAIWVIFKLEEPAIPNSVHGYFGNSPMKPPLPVVGNVVYACFSGKWKDQGAKEYIVNYVPDPKGTQKFKTMEKREDKVYLDGRELMLPSVTSNKPLTATSP